MRQRINLAKEYASAAKQLRTQDPTVNYPASNPFTLDQLLNDEVNDLLARLAP